MALKRSEPIGDIALMSCNEAAMKQCSVASIILKQ